MAAVVIETITLWIIIGAWICYKRDWYESSEAPGLWIVVATVFMPINFLIIFFQMFILDKWNNDN